jgi:hypothetical protein
MTQHEAARYQSDEHAPVCYNIPEHRFDAAPKLPGVNLDGVGRCERTVAKCSPDSGWLGMRSWAEFEEGCADRRAPVADSGLIRLRRREE